jgi:NADH dehydrogenase
MTIPGQADLAYSRVTVFGGSGFLGRQIVGRLAGDGAQVRVAVRHPERASSPIGARTAGQIIPVYADVWDDASVAPALEGSDAVINTVGHYVERGSATFEAIHGHGAMRVARAAALAGVERLVHISGIGADAASASTYVRARAIGERLVRERFPDATILRPSVMFGPDDTFLNRLAAMARVMPVLPLFGNGETRLQPVYVSDVAEAVAKVLTAASARGQVYELGGPRIYTYKALVQLVLKQIERQRLLMPVPFPVWELLGSLLAPLPKRPISRDQVILMKQDNVVAPQAATFADLGIVPTSIEEILPTYLGRRPAEPAA